MIDIIFVCAGSTHTGEHAVQVKLSIIMYPCSYRVFQSSVRHGSEELETRCYSLLILVMVLTSDETLEISMLHGKGNIFSISYHPWFLDTITGTDFLCQKFLPVSTDNNISCLYCNYCMYFLCFFPPL